MPTEQQRLTALLTGTVAAAAAIAITYWARSVLIPIALAILLSFVLAPIVTRLHRYGVNRVLSVAITVGMAMTVSGGVGALLSRQVVQLANSLPDRREAIKEKIVSARNWIAGEGNNRFGDLIDDITATIAPQSVPQDVVVVKPVSSPIATQFETYLSPVAEVFGQAAFAFILTVFILLRREDLRNRAIRLIGAGRIMATTKAVDDASRRISRYLLRQLILNISFGVVIALGMLLLGVDYAFLWGAIAALMRYVPFIGTWIGLVLPFGFSITTAQDWGQPLGVLALYLVPELICGNFLEPRVFGQSMGTSEVAQLVAAAVWAFLWGPIGLILSGPITACLLVLGRHVPRFRFLVVLLGDEPPLKPAMAFYQRLAARDQDEASEVAQAAAKELGVEECYDRVLIPALCRARHDAARGELDAHDLRFIVEATEEVAVELQGPREPGHGDDEPVRILICPAREKAEKVAAEIFAYTLDSSRWEVEVVGDEMVAGELLERVAEFRPSVVVIAVVPPGGITHSNYLTTRLKRSFPDLKVVVGRWGGEGETTQTELTHRGIDVLTQTLAGTRKELEDLHGILVSAKAPA